MSLTILQIVSYLLLLTKLFRSGLWTKYRYFSCYIAFESFRIAVMMALPYRSKLYAHIFFATQPIVWLFFILVVLELFQLVLQKPRRDRFVGKKSIDLSLILSAVISGATLLIELQEIGPNQPSC